MLALRRGGSDQLYELCRALRFRPRDAAGLLDNGVRARFDRRQAAVDAAFLKRVVDEIRRVAEWMAHRIVAVDAIDAPLGHLLDFGAAGPGRGIEIRRRHLTVRAMHFDERDPLLVGVKRDILEILRDMPVDALRDADRGARLRRRLLGTAGECPAGTGVQLQRGTALRALGVAGVAVFHANRVVVACLRPVARLTRLARRT